MMADPLDLDHSYPCDLLTAVAQEYLRSHVSGPARAKAWKAFTGALEYARAHDGAGDDVMPWDEAPKAREPASAITPEAVHAIMLGCLAETVPPGQMSDEAWQERTIARLSEIEEAELGRLFSDKNCPKCGRPRGKCLNATSCRKARYYHRQRDKAASTV